LIRPALQAMARSVAAPAAVPATKAYIDAYLASLKKPAADPSPSDSGTNRGRQAKDKLVGLKIAPAIAGELFSHCELCKCLIKNKNREKHLAKAHPGGVLRVPVANHETANGNDLGTCKVCSSRIKLKNLAKHLAKIHPEGSAAVQKDSAESANNSAFVTCAACGCKVMRRYLKSHMREQYPGWALDQSSGRIAIPNIYGLPIVYMPVPKQATQKKPVPDPQGCGAVALPQLKEQHFASCDSSEEEVLLPSRIAETFPFELLPPGEKEVWEAIERKSRQSHAHSYSFNGRWLDRDRFRQIELLNPVAHYVGDKSWLGYVVFEFAGTSNVVLESPFEGNAVYILPASWRSIIRLNKAEIRNEYEYLRPRVFHTGNWLRRVSNALRSRVRDR